MVRIGVDEFRDSNDSRANNDLEPTSTLMVVLTTIMSIQDIVRWYDVAKIILHQYHS